MFIETFEVEWEAGKVSYDEDGNDGDQAQKHA